jgi:AcrR family transcriptional regulator
MIVMPNEKETAKERRKERERQVRRNAIIDTAEEFFVSRGYDDTNVDDLAKQAGYTKATIYNYFESKDDLFVAVTSRAFANLCHTLEQYMKKPGIPYELRSMGDAYLYYVESFPVQSGLFESNRLGLVIGNILTKEEDKEIMTESETEFIQNQRCVEKLMMEVITQTMTNAGVQEKVDPFKVIMALSSLGTAIRDLVFRGRQGDDPEAAREYLNVLFNIIDQGLKHYSD